MIKLLSLNICILISIFSLTQNFDLNNQWQTIGPIELPSPNSRASAKRIGPIEFIRTTPLEKGFLLAGTLSGGLFFSSDGGENWLNSGSDNWPYSAAAWADFYPENSNVWFGCSHQLASKSGKGSLGLLGGVYRTNDRSSSWKLIGDYVSFGGRNEVKIYKTMFDPNQSKKMYVLTSKGLFYTNDCLAVNVKWVKDKIITTETFDMIFVGNKRFIYTKHKDSCVLYLENKIPVAFSELQPSTIKQFTFAKEGINLYVLIDYKSGSDRIYRYNYFEDEFIQISQSQRVTFGSGRAFEINPNEIYLGVGTRLKKWNISENKFEKIGTDYHVDVEFVTFDPFDENIIYMANHGGVYISYDKGKSWDSKSNNLGVAEVLGMAVGKTDPNQIVIGTYHDGSSIYANWDDNGNYYWKNVNGGDALIPLINPSNCAEVYRSNQYLGGGIYYSNDTSKTVSNIISKNGLKTAGWGMAASLHPTQTNYLFFNSKETKGESKGSSDVYRTHNASERMNAVQISNFNLTHNLKIYSVYGMYASENHPNLLLAYVLEFYKDDEGNQKVAHRMFRTFNSLNSMDTMINSWHELKLPRDNWLADVQVDKKSINKMYFSYKFGYIVSEDYPEKTGMVYDVKYRSRNNKLIRDSDSSYPIENCGGGKYNLVYSNSDKKIMFVGTMNGVFMREKSCFSGENG